MLNARSTRDSIAEAAAPLFNTHGFAGTSMAEVMDATGLQKGGLYNHFSSKEALAEAAFDHSLAAIRRRLDLALEGKESAADRLLAMAEVIASHAIDPVVDGGCPILNLAVEADDAVPALRDRAREAMERWHGLVKGTIRRGISRGEIRPDVDGSEFATLFLASLEGAVVMSRLEASPGHIGRILDFLRREIDSMRCA